MEQLTLEHELSDVDHLDRNRDEILKFSSENESILTNVNTRKREVEVSEFDKKELDIFAQLFRNQGGYKKEKWSSEATIQSKVVKLNDNCVFVDCLINRESKKFELREYPIILFNHIENLKVGSPILVRIGMKEGSAKIDIYDGRGVVDLALFSLNDEWEKLRGSNLDTPFDGWK